MHTTNRGEWSRYETSAYRDARRAGMPLSLAFARALSERVAHKILPPRDTTDGPAAVSYRVDALELERATTDPRTDALFGAVVGPDGERILSRVILPADARATVTVRDDYYSDPRTDGDCYGPDDIAAWQSDAWRYCTVEAFVQLPDGRNGTATMGGVEIGAYWQLSDEAMILHTVASLVSEALAEASRPAPVTMGTMPGDAITVDGVTRIVTSAVRTTFQGRHGLSVAHVAPDDVDNATAIAHADVLEISAPDVRAFPV